MKARSRFALITTTIAALTLSAMASADMKANSGTVSFVLPGPIGMTIKGSSPKLTVAEAGGKIVITVPFLCGHDEDGDVGCFKTGIGLRDRHLIHYAGTKPAVFSIEKSKLTIPDDGKNASGKVTGTLELNGTSAPQVINYKVSRAGGEYTVSGDAIVTLKQFGIEPGYKGVGTGKEATLKLDFKLHDG